MKINVSVEENDNYFIPDIWSDKTLDVYSSEDVFDNYYTTIFETISKDNNKIRISEGNTLEVSRAINDLEYEIKNYKVIKVENNSDGLFYINLNESVDPTKYIKVFSYVNGEFVEIEYKIEDGRLVINCLDGSSLVLIQLDNHLTRNIIIMVVYLIFACACISIVIVFCVKNKKTY